MTNAQREQQAIRQANQALADAITPQQHVDRITELYNSVSKVRYEIRDVYCVGRCYELILFDTPTARPYRITSGGTLYYNNGEIDIPTAQAKALYTLLESKADEPIHYIC